MPSVSLAPPLRRLPPGRSRELMDRPDCDRASLAEALEVLSRAHRWLGGERLLWREVWRLLRPTAVPRRPRELEVLEVGAGSGIPAARLRRRLGRLRIRARMLLGDLHPAVPGIARDRLRATLLPGDEGRFAFLRLDGARLPLADRSVDLAVSSLTLHHMERADAVRFLAELDRVCRIGWVLTDLRRSRISYAGVRLLAATVWRRAEYPRADGPVSTLRAFTPREARRLLREAGVAESRVAGRVFRLAIVGRSRT